jgi:hypothetical protein
LGLHIARAGPVHEQDRLTETAGINTPRTNDRGLAWLAQRSEREEEGREGLQKHHQHSAQK